MVSADEKGPQATYHILPQFLDFVDNYRTYCILYTGILAMSSVVDPNTLNLDPDPGLCYQF